jgi:hypothetical protein
VAGQQALLPFADYLNHDPRTECHLDYDPAAGCVAITLDREKKKGRIPILAQLTPQLHNMVYGG